MEDCQHVRTAKQISVFVIASFLLLWPIFVFAYSTRTHAALTDETIDFFKKDFPDVFSDTEKEIVKQGSVDEDKFPRWLHHFYDPIFSRGLKGIQLSSKEWAKATLEQAGFASVGLGSVNELFSADDDYSWDRAIYEYAWGDRDRGLKTLGHILHLIQDASVPDHTRDDAHPPVFGWGSPYEHWTKQFDDGNLDIVSKLNEKPVFLGELNMYFDNLAGYSNKNFFSKDSINSYRFPESIRAGSEFINGGHVLLSYALDENNREYKLSKLFQDPENPELFIPVLDDFVPVLDDYWSRLSKQAVLHGAGVIKLFFDEVEKERETKVLFNQNRSWFQKAFDATKNTIFNTASVFYGSSVTLADLETDLAVPPPSDLETGFSSEEVVIVAAVETPPAKPQSEPAQTTLVAEAETESDSEKSPEETAKAQSANPETSQTRDPFGLVAIPLSSAGAGGGINDIAASATSSTSQTTTTPQDTTGPDLTFSITQCLNSLSSSGCVSTSTTATLNWSSASSDLASYTLECQIGSQNCSGFPKTYSATSSVQTSESLNDFTIYNFIVKAIDQTGNQTQISKTIETASRPVVINEVAWMGTASSTNDEWLELYNITSKPINFGRNWVLRTANNAPYITLTGSIAGKGYYLLERTDDLTVNDVAANQIYGNDGSNWALNNTGENVLLEMVSGTATSTIDEIPLCSNWCVKGDNNNSSGLPKRTMERIDPLTAGIDSNWATALGEFILNGKDASGAAIGGTPKAKNSASYLARLAPVSGGVRLLKKQNSPYLIDRVSLVIPQGETLSVEPGVVVKIVSNSEPKITVNGTINSGSSADGVEPAVFTAFEDDTYGGDLNADGICEPGNASSTAACPSPGIWMNIIINSSSQNSSFSNTLIRYGGKYFTTAPQNLRAMVAVDNTSVTFASTTIEQSKKHGLYLNNSASQISGSTFRSNGDSTDNNDAAGVYAASSSPSITTSTFAGNRYGLYLDGSPEAAVSSNTFTNNAVEAFRVSMGQKAIGTFSSNSGSGNGVNGVVLSGALNSNGTTTLALNTLPYVIEGIVDVSASSTLTFASQNIVKGYPNIGSSAGKLVVKNGAKLFFEGASASDLIFTSLYDDSVGGNADNAANTPSAGDWYGVVVESGGQVQLKGFTLRYAGLQTGIGAGDNRAGINVDTGSGIVESALIEKNFQNGIRLNSVNSFSVKNSTIRNHTEEGLAQAAGVQAIDSTINMDSITFSANDLDIRASGAYFVTCTNCGSPVTSPNPL